MNSTFARAKLAASKFTSTLQSATNSTIVRQGGKYATLVAKHTIPGAATVMSVASTAMSVGSTGLRIYTNPVGFAAEKATAVLTSKPVMIAAAAAGTYLVGRAIRNRYFKKASNVTANITIDSKPALDEERKTLAMGMLIFVTIQLFVTIAIVKFS